MIEPLKQHMHSEVRQVSLYSIRQINTDLF